MVLCSKDPRVEGQPKKLMEQPLKGVDAVRAEGNVRVPVVLTPEEVRRFIALVSGTIKLLFPY
jgi:hypothetical protein